MEPIFVFHGRTNNAEIPEHLLSNLEKRFPTELLEKVFPIKYDDTGAEILTQVDILGEGYGFKIQKGKNYIKEDTSFILFDVRINTWWLLRKSIEDIAQKLNINIVPIIGYYTIAEAEAIVKQGFKSTIAENKEYEAEGLVLKTSVGLPNREGKRIITKTKTVDYRKLANI